MLYLWSVPNLSFISLVLHHQLPSLYTSFTCHRRHSHHYRPLYMPKHLKGPLLTIAPKAQILSHSFFSSPFNFQFYLHTNFTLCISVSFVLCTLPVLYLHTNFTFCISVSFVVCKCPILNLHIMFHRHKLSHFSHIHVLQMSFDR